MLNRIQRPNRITAWAPPKLNLFLHITGRRPDGYHTLQTVFQLLDYCDEMEFRPQTGNRIQLHCSAFSPLLDLDLHPALKTEANLVHKAAHLLQSRYGLSAGVDIRLRKCIPIGGGLGGGSSNAATTLLALNRLWGLNAPLSELVSVGLSLGADIPIFLHGRTAWGESIGERLTPIETPAHWFVVVVPPVSVLSQDVLKEAQLTRNTTPITIEAFLQGSVEIHNDCEALVCARYPMIAHALETLNRFAPARLTGTGACVFASVGSQLKAEAILKQLPQTLCGFVAAGVSQSPKMLLSPF